MLINKSVVVTIVLQKLRELVYLLDEATCCLLELFAKLLG